MFRKLQIVSAAAIALSLAPAQLWAGGPPRLCLPIDGVTAQNAAACAQRLKDALGDKLWSDEELPRAVQIHQDEKQFYVACYLREPVTLAEVERAFAKSEFSIPKDKLRLFGHVILQIDASTESPDKLIAGLSKLDYVSVEESKQEQGMLLLTLDLPYPELGESREEWQPFTAGAFRRGDFSSNASRSRSELPASSRSLPSYDALGDVVAKHNGKLKDVRWSNNWGCRTLGAVTAAAKDVQAGTRGNPTE